MEKERGSESMLRGAAGGIAMRVGKAGEEGRGGGVKIGVPHKQIACLDLVISIHMTGSPTARALATLKG